MKAHSTKAFRAFKDPTHPARQHWLAIRGRVMFQIVLAKFQGNRAARTALLESGHRFLVEASPTDDYWGIGSSPTPQILQLGPFVNWKQWGLNKLGRILMGVRNTIRNSIRTRKEITNRHSRRIVKRATDLYGVPQHQLNFYSHFRKQLVPGIARAARPKRRCLKTSPLRFANPLWRARGIHKVTKISWPQAYWDSKWLFEL